MITRREGVNGLLDRCGSAIGRPRRGVPRRRGVVSVLSMMFLILFGSLAAAMAIMSKGNITTAATHQHVIRAQGAAETGLAIAESRLRDSVRRFIVERGEVDAGFAARLWSGSYGTGDGQVIVRDSALFTGGGTPEGVAGALVQLHQRDRAEDRISIGGITEAIVVDGTVFTPAIALTPQPPPPGGGQPPRPPTGAAFQITYRHIPGTSEVEVAAIGYDFDYTANGEPVSRRIVQRFNLAKRIQSAVLAPSKIMIGKNVLVEGDLGATFTDVTRQYGDPLVIRSDFMGLESGLDAELTKLFNAIRVSDVDRDNRLRVSHPTEGASIPSFANLPGFTHTTPEGLTVTGPDVTRDGYVDEFDVFIMYYDGRNGGVADGRIALHPAISAGTPHASLTPEFVLSGGVALDNGLGMLIDAANPDRNRNGEWRFLDRNGNGRFDPGVDELLDQEIVSAGSVPPELQNYVYTTGSGQQVVYRDQILGFRDGVIDRKDQYSKVRGRLLFRTSSNAWTAAQGDFMERLRGPITPPVGSSAMQFAMGDQDLPEITAANFTNTRNALQQIASGATFEEQVAQNLGISVSQLATWTAANNSPDPTAPRLTPLAPDANRDGMPDNWQVAYFERMPFNSPSFVDWYYRPVYENMTFKNVQIPKGNNALFRNCTFVGVTWVRTNTSNTHANWTIYGRKRLGGGGRPVMEPTRVEYTGTSFPTMLSPTDRPVWMATTPLDKADIPANEIPVTQGYNLLPDPLIIDGLRVINTKAESNNIRFHDCLFVGSIVSDAPQIYTNARNKLQFTGGTKFTTVHPTAPLSPQLNPDPADMSQILRSSMMLPQYSVDIGSFNSPPSQDVRLRGAIIAGVLDVRGNADIQGSLVLTFKPVLGEAPMVDSRGNPVGNPANFNASIGYFGREDGDEESLDPATLPVVGGVRIVGWDANGDGEPDFPPTPTPPAQAPSATPVPFNGFGQITLRFDPTMALPDGIMLPLTVEPVRGTYKETRQ